MGLFDLVKKLFEWLFRVDQDGRTTSRENKEYDEDGYKRLKTITDIKEKITDKIKDKDNKDVTKAVFELLELTQQNNSSNKTILNQIIRSITREAILEYAPTNDNLKELTRYESPVELDKDMNELRNEKNTKKIKNIDRIHAGLWNWDANLKINARETGKWGFTVKEVVANEAFDVKGVTVETVLEKTGQEEIDILKIDIEGSEKEVFEKNTQGWINRVKVLVVELHDRYKPGCTEAVLKAIDMNKWHRYQKGDKTIFVRKDVAGY